MSIYLIAGLVWLIGAIIVTVLIRYNILVIDRERHANEAFIITFVWPFVLVALLYILIGTGIGKLIKILIYNPLKKWMRL